MPKNLHLCVLSLGVALMAVAVARNGTLTADDLRITGAVLTLAALGLVAVRRFARSEDAIYDHGHRDGWAEGYDAGRKVRASVVALPVEKLCRKDAAPRGRHAAKCRDNCRADPKEEGVRIDSPEWTQDGAG